MKNFLLTISALLFTGLTLLAQDRIERMDPPNWWVGMNWNTVQIMLYGEDLAGMQASLEHPGVRLVRSSSLDNPNYLFLDLEISPDAEPGEIEIRFKSGETIAFPLFVREPGRREIRGFDPSDAIYLITPDRFANGDPSNDNVEGMLEKVNRKEPCGRHGGDLAGIRENLDFISGLGFTAIWLNPVLENNMERQSYHGYSTTDFYKVDPRYGSNEEYKQLADEARSKGMETIMDMIVNHIGSNHWWMDDLPSEDWINFGGEYVPTNHKRTSLQDPYASDYDKMMFQDGWFVRTMPDLNQRNSYMGDYLIQNSIWWVEYLGLAGIRMDTYPYPDQEYMGQWTRAMMEEYPNFNIVGEEWSAMPGQVSYWQRGKENKNGYTSWLPSVLDFPTQMTMVESLNQSVDEWNIWVPLYENLGQDYMYPDPFNLVIFPDNHDMMRIYPQLKEHYGHLKMALTYTATMRGIPQYYYGTEILMSGTSDHCTLRADYPGGWNGDRVNAFTGKGLSDKQKQAMEFMGRLLNWRKTSDAIHKGDLMHYAPFDKAYVYFRFTEEQVVMVVMNKNDKEVSMPLSRFGEVLEPGLSGFEVISGEGVTMGEELVIGAGEVMILDLKK